MTEIRYARGVFLPKAGIWLDPSGRKEFAFVSHAHMDHTGRHERILCSPATARLTAERTGLSVERFQTHPFGRQTDFGSWQATLLPAGHVLGSAQLFVEINETTLLYTGDFKMRASLTCERIEHRKADTLIMETTFGLPRYRFPPAEETLAAIIQFCHEALEDGAVPVLLAYALGKAQEVLAALEVAGLPIMIHGSVAKMVNIYREFGIAIPPFQPWEPRAAAGHVVICPPGVAGSKALGAIKPRLVAALTGWALDSGTVFRMGVDAAFPVSDHAGYDELLEYVALVNPGRVFTLHGFAQEFARDLRARGIEAWALGAPNQMEWDILAPPPSLPPPPRHSPLGGSGFDAFARACEAIRLATGKIQKAAILVEFFSKLDSCGLQLVTLWLTGRAFSYSDKPVLHPALIRKSLARATGLPELEVRTVSRRNKDLGKAAVELLSIRGSAKHGDSPLEEIAALFQSLATPGSPTAKIERLAEALSAMHPVAASYLIGIIGADVRIGLKAGLVEMALAEACDRPVELPEDRATSAGTTESDSMNSRI